MKRPEISKRVSFFLDSRYWMILEKELLEKFWNVGIERRKKELLSR